MAHHLDHDSHEDPPGLWRHRHPHTHPNGDLHHRLLPDGAGHDHWHLVRDDTTLPDHHPTDNDSV